MKNIKEKIQELLTDIEIFFSTVFAYIKKDQVLLLAVENEGTRPASPLRDRTENNYLRQRETMNEEEIISEDQSSLNKDDDIELEDQEREEINIQQEPESNLRSQNTKVIIRENAFSVKVKKLLNNPSTYFATGVAIFILFIIGLFLVIFPKKFSSHIPPVLCGGPSKLDDLKIITRTPSIKDMNGEVVKPGIWLDAWDFYDYIIAVVNNEVATSLITVSNSLNGADSEIMKNEEYYKTIDFAYYQAQAIASVSYALNPDVGNYLDEAQKKKNNEKYFKMCPKITAETEFTPEDLAAGKIRRPNGYMICREDWLEDAEIIVAINGTVHQTACSIKRGCYNWGIPKEDGDLICEVDDETKETISTDPRCLYTSDLTGQTNSGKKIFIKSSCSSTYKTNDFKLDGSSGPEDLEITCKNNYCKKFPDDPDCATAPNEIIPLRAYVNLEPKITNAGVETIDGEKNPARLERWLKRERYLNQVVTSIRGIVMTDINGTPGRTDYKGHGRDRDILQCQNDLHNPYPRFRNDMCHARETSEEYINAFYQSVVLRWPVHKILSYWYDYYFSSWSEDGRADCHLIDTDIEKELGILNYEKETNSLKFPLEKDLGEILTRYEQVRLSKASIEDGIVIEDDKEKEAELIARSKKENSEYEINRFNQYIYDNAIAPGNIGKGKSVAGAAIALTQFTQIYDVKMPYTLGGNYHQLGVNPLWGTQGSDGRPLGLDCIGFTTWALLNGGLKPGFSGHGELAADYDSGVGGHPYAKGYDIDQFGRRVNVGNFGDIIYHAKGSDEFAHAKVIVGYAFNAKNVLVGNIVAEAVGKDDGIKFNVVSVRTGKKMTLVEREAIYNLSGNYSQISEEEYNELSEEEQDYYNEIITREETEENIIKVKVSEYVDFCYHDPNLTIDYGSFNANTSNCGEYSSEPYVVIDYSSCYDERKGYQDKKICEKEEAAEYLKKINLK